MAFTRATIRSLAKESGVEIPKEFEDALVSEHISARDAYAEEQVKAEAAKAPTEKAVNVKDSDEYKALQKSFDDYKADVSAKETKSAKSAAYRELLKSAGVSEKRIDSILKVSDIDAVELEDGKVKDAEKLTETIKTEWADFIVATQTQGAQTPNPPANNNAAADLGKMDMKDYIAARKKSD